MRLRRLLIEQYGCFEHADLHFATEPGRITLVVAPNGAGKSVLRQAFHDLLFDIPLQSPMQFRFGYPRMALRAEAIAADGTPFDFGWVRQGKPQRTTTDPARYAALRKESTPRQLEQLFALDTGRLRKGGTDLKGGETLAGALLSGTGELAPAKAVRAELAARREANWGRGKSKPPLNAALAALVRTRGNAHSAVQRPAHREQQERELEAHRATHAAAKRDHQDALVATRRLNRIALTRPHLEALSIAEAWLDAHPDAPALPSGLDQRLADAREGMAQAQTDRAAKQEAVDAAEQQAVAIERDTAVAEHAVALGHLPGMLGEAEKTAKDIVARRTERAATLAQIGTALRDIGASVPVGQAGSLIPSVAVTAAARAAITEHAGRRKAWELAGVRAREAQRALTDAEGELATATPAPDGLSALLREVRSDRNPVQHAIAVADAMSAAQAQLRAALAQAPGWAAGAAALRGLAPPSEATFERLDAARTAAVALERDRAALQDRLATDLNAMRRSLATMHEQPLPDAAAISAARAARDRGWRLIQRRVFPPGQPDVGAERAYSGDEQLPLVFERHVRAADDLADRRIAELDRVTEAERLARHVADLEVQWGAACQAAAVAAAVAARAGEAWAAVCLPLGLGPDATIADLRGLLAARLRVIEAMQAVEVAEGAASAVAEAHSAWVARLAMMLEVPVQPLPALLALGDARLDAALQAERASTLQQARLDAARREQQAAEDALDAAKADLSTWEIGWAATLAQLGRPAAERPDATAAVLERLAILDQLDQKATALAERIADMQADLDGFGAAVCGLAEALREAVQPDPVMAARALIARRDGAAKLDSGWDQAQLSLGQRRTVLAAAGERLCRAQHAIDAVIAAAGAGTVTEADARIAAAREHARYAAMRDAALSGLREHGDGRVHDKLWADAEAVPAEEMAGERDAAEAAVTNAGTRAEAAAVQLDKLRIVFDEDANRTAAIETRAEYEAAATLYARRLEEQLVLQVASSMLARAMAAVEHDAGGSGLKRISDAFAAVTDGAYGVTTAEDSPDGAVLYAVEHRFPQEHKELQQLSEGTRDQLYLALRLVALRDHCAVAPPLPFIADDILQTFDDDRATAALRALVELSADLQVIVLTHHQHVARLAEGLAPGCVNIQRL
jgi:uncharacterized protein YhaN